MHPKDVLDISLIAGKHVVMVDIAFSANVIEEAAKRARGILILDHHVTNQKTLDELCIPNVHAVFVMGRAGVHLAWEYVHHEQPIPRTLDYIGLKDVWQHEKNEKAFYYMTAFVRPETLEKWQALIQDVYQDRIETINNGRVIHNYQQSVLKTMMGKVEYTSWRGYRMAIANVPFPWIGDLGAMICKELSETTIAVIWNKQVTGPFFISLRSNDTHGPNVEAIAREFGGGGHIHAAGMRSQIAPYELFAQHL